MRLFSILALIFFCVVPLYLGARQIQPSGFHIAIIDGDGALNNVKGRLAREPIIQVEDRNHKPVVGAYVVFDLPANGPGGVFADGSTHFVTTTDAYGRAVAQGLRPNTVGGKFEIHVHVTYQGQPVGDVTIHQANVSGQVANLSENVQDNGKEANTAGIAAGVVGVVVGAEFLVNGSSMPGNANLANGARIQTLGATVKLYLHDHCEFLVAPHSAVTAAPSQLVLQDGILRAVNFGNCKVSYGGLLVRGLQDSSDGVVGVATDGIQVASIDGTVQVLAADGSVAGTVEPGTVSTFGTAPVASSGATAARPMAHKRIVLYGLTIGASLAALGLTLNSVLQSGPPPTSP